MATTGQELKRAFFDLPTDENTQIETAEMLADLAIGGRIGWSTLLDSERILIVSEAGMGKTYECQCQQQRLWEEGRSAFFVELATLATDPLERQFSAEENAQMFSVKKAFDTNGLLNPGKVIPTLQRCAEYGRMLVRAGRLAHPDLPRF